MLDTIMILGIVGASMTVIDHILSWLPFENSPKSVSQLIIWICHKIYKLFKPDILIEQTPLIERGLVEITI